MNMYTTKELRGLCRDNYHKNGYTAYLIFFFSMVVVAGVIAINLWLPYFFYLLVPMLIIPIFFACQASIILLRDAEQLTLGGFFKCFFGYFGEHFRSTFRVIRSFLFSLIFFGGIFFTSLIVTFISFYFTNYCGFHDLVNSINILDVTSVTAIDEILNKYAYAINMYGICTSFPALTAMTFVFIYLCSKSSVSLFLRLNNYKITGRYLGIIHANVMKKNRKLFLKYYWSLNWPLCVLLVLGFGLGAYVGTLYQLSATSLYTFGLIIALFVAFVFYGPTYLANKEAISIAFKEQYDEESNLMASQIAASMEEFMAKIKEYENRGRGDDEDSGEDS